MGRGFGDALSAMLACTLACLIGATVLATLAVVFGVPWLWALLKPWIHAISA